MPIEFKEPGQMILSIFDSLIDRIKSTRPIKTDGKSLTTGFVYCQLPLGMPCDPKDYNNAWQPMGGVTLQDTVPPDETSQAAEAAKFQKAMQAAFNTSRLADTLIMVTNDDSFLEYPTGRHLSFSYQGIINGMQAKPAPPRSPEVQKQIDEATKVLYELDVADNSIIGKSRIHKTYLKNASAYAVSKMEYAEAQAAALADPVKAGTWPMASAVYQQKVDEAYDTLKTEGAEKVEWALAILESVGINMQEGMIAKARKIYDAWNLGLGGVADKIAYSSITPSRWCDPTADDIGFQTLTVSRQQYSSQASFKSSSLAESHFQSDNSTTGGGGGLNIFGFGAYGSGGSSSKSWSNTYKSESGSEYHFHNDAKNLTITINYGLASFNRPGVVSDLNYMDRWYLVNNFKHSISDGTIEGQLRNADKQLPMIPQQVFVINNVKIHADQSDWRSDGQTLKQMYSDSQTQGKSWDVKGGGGFSLGWLTIGGTGGHSEGHTSSSFSSKSTEESDSSTGWYFNGEDLVINGTQIMAFLCEVTPAAPPEDDPGLAP
jgi:hypothetical protein